MSQQKTIKSENKVSGKGLFGGKEAKVIFKPAEADKGIVFVRTDLDAPVEIPVLPEYISQRDRRSALQNGDAYVETPEHCLAAIHALGIDNMVIEIDGPELPGLDGSSENYFEAIFKCGIVEQSASRRDIVITDSICITEGDKSIYSLPNGGQSLSITYDLDSTQFTGIGRQAYSRELSEIHFK